MTFPTKLEELIYESGILGNLAVHAINSGDAATAAHYARNAAQYYFEACGNRKTAFDDQEERRSTAIESYWQAKQGDEYGSY